MRYRIDSMSLRDGTLVIEGWCIPKKAGKIEYTVTDLQGHLMKCTAVARDRADVASQFGADRMSGFTVAVPFERDQDAYLVMRDGGTVRRVRLSSRIVEKRNSIKAKRAEKLWALVHLETLVVSFDFICENGLRAFIKKAVHKIQKIDEDFDYPEWQLKTALKPEEIEAQKKAWQELEFPGGTPPLISIVIPAYNTPEKYLSMLFDSLTAQTYPLFEVIVADGSDVPDSRAAEGASHDLQSSGTTGGAETAVAAVTKKYACSDSRFRIIPLHGNRGISGNTNAGLDAARGDYIALCDHDDELPPWALFEVAKAISQNPDAEFIYTDEDKIDFDGKALFEPHFKPDFNMDLLTSVNYICHLSVIRRSLLERTGGFREEYDGAQDHDFFFRCLENAVRDEEKALEEYYALAASAAVSGTAGLDGPGIKYSAAVGGSADTSALSEADTGSESAQAAAASTGTTSALPEAGIMAVSGSAEGGYCSVPERLGDHALKLLSEGRFVSEKVVHVPVICYHWRYHRGSTASDPKSKLYAFEAGRRAVAAHYDRMGVPYTGIERGVTYGYYHTMYSRGDEPLVSVIIPNKDHAPDLDKCIRSLAECSEYRNLEFIIVENNSEQPETFAYYKLISNYDDANADCPYAVASSKGIDMGSAAESVSAAYKPLDKTVPVRIVYWDGVFNYSAINNFGVRYARGDLLLFLNNDVELINPASITEMVSLALRERTGIVGARLTYGDDTIQHAGVIVGLGGIAGAAFVGLHEKENSYMHRMMCVQDLSAVTAACMMMRREVFEKAGGFREELAVAFNDIDLCMKVRALGKLVIYNPYVTFHHYESRSRGLEDTPEKVQRFNNEIAIFAHYWGAILLHGDPYYNPSLTLRKSNFALRDLTKEKPGEPYALELDVEKQLKTVLREKERRGLS